MRIKVKKTYKKKLKINTLLIFIIIIIQIILGSYIYIWILDNYHSKELNETIQNKVIKIDKTDHNDKIDFNKLLGINKETVGWIEISNTNINYPIVQTTNNDYYLNHLIDGSINNVGSIFLDYRNDKNFNDMNTIIYGHNLKSGQMFSELSNILYGKADSKLINIYTKDKLMTYEIFSVYQIEPEYYYTNIDIDECEYEYFLNTLKNRSVIYYDVEMDIKDKIITLSTCDSTGDERIVVHAKYIEN